jgi:hypothetical protein
VDRDGRVRCTTERGMAALLLVDVATTWAKSNKTRSSWG